MIKEGLKTIIILMRLYFYKEKGFSVPEMVNYIGREHQLTTYNLHRELVKLNIIEKENYKESNGMVIRTYKINKKLLFEYIKGIKIFQYIFFIIYDDLVDVMLKEPFTKEEMDRLRFELKIQKN